MKPETMLKICLTTLIVTVVNLFATLYRNEDLKNKAIEECKQQAVEYVQKKLLEKKCVTNSKTNPPTVECEE